MEQQHIDKKSIGFKPQEGPQSFFLSCPCDEILYGGARGGGKTHAALGMFWKHAEEYKHHAKGMLIRQTYPQLSDVMNKAAQMYAPVAVKREGGKLFKFHNGATLEMRHLDNGDDASDYQGKEFTMIIIEEAGNYYTPDNINKLRATLRSPVEGIKKQFIFTANPGGPGNNWLKKMFVDPAPPMTPFETSIKVGDKETKISRVYIPAKVSDNKVLLENDPNYEAMIALSVEDQPHLLRAWLEGDWDVVAGGMFDDLWNADVHILKPFQIPSSWEVYRAFDWGSSAPFSVGWWAVTDGSAVTLADGRMKTFPPKTMIQIAEWYGCSKFKDEVGIKLSEAEFCEGLKAREVEIKKTFSVPLIQPGPADTSIWDEDSFNKESIADFHQRKGIKWRRADKSPGSRIAGWAMIRQKLKASLSTPMEDPGLFVFSTCRKFINIFPSLPRDEKKVEDLDTKSCDHVADMCRYMVRHKPTKSVVTRFAKGGYA